MIDGCGRQIDHLRLSLTDHCNLACRYCVPAGLPTPGRMIDARFAFQIAAWLSERHGIRHLRLTGGEPLLHPQLVPLVEHLSQLDSLHELTLTTNAQTLAPKAAALHQAGLSRVNVSLDTLDPARFAHLTRGGSISRTLSGIEAAIAAGLTPLKINVIAQRGLNDHELPDIAQWGLARGCVVRFLEVMPIGPMAHVASEHLVPAELILARLRERFELRTMPQPSGQPARDYAVIGNGLRGVIGIIAPTTRPFCAVCRRLRVTSDGMLVSCLHDCRRFDLTRCWNGQTLDIGGADATLRQALAGKPARGSPSHALTMLRLGG